ncbi:MAG: tripartite tricarboxylate transporter substrate-binding protein [Xanthobacteraceae bacterium]
MPVCIAFRIRALAFALAILPGSAAAQGTPEAEARAYPDRAIHLIVPFPPGGPADLIARFVGQRMSQDWGQPVVIENRAGGNTAIGAQVAARAVPTATRCSRPWIRPW